MDAPIYLKKYTKEIDNLPGFKYQNWFSDLSWKGQLSIDDCSLFSVYFEGVLCEDGSIASTDKSPLRVYAKRQGYNEKIVLFDEELYGYLYRGLGILVVWIWINVWLKSIGMDWIEPFYAKSDG